MIPGDALFSASVKDEREHGWLQYKAPQDRRFVLLLIGTVAKDAHEFDVDAALNRLGWFFREDALGATVPESGVRHD